MFLPVFFTVFNLLGLQWAYLVIRVFLLTCVIFGGLSTVFGVVNVEIWEKEDPLWLLSTLFVYLFFSKYRWFF